MYTIARTATFDSWLAGLTDARGKTAILRRLDRLAAGNAGDWAAVGGGVCELRIDVGPGYRVYYARSGATVYLLLCGGDKGSQTRDITMSLAMWNAIKAAK